MPKQQPDSKAPRAPRLRADARENHDRILQAAHARFAAEGVGASMDDIARDAGVAVGTIYHRFGAKEGLIRAVFSRGLEEFAQHIQRLLEHPDAAESVRQLIFFMAERQQRDRAFKDLLGSSPELRAGSTLAKQALGPPIQQLLARAQAAGSLRPDVVAGDLTHLLAGLPDGPDEHTARQRFLAIILDGLGLP